MSTSHSSLHTWLQSAGLSSLSSRLISAGVTEETFSALPLHELESFGIIMDSNSMERLKELQLVVREEQQRERQRQQERMQEELERSIKRTNQIRTQQQQQTRPTSGLSNYFPSNNHTAGASPMPSPMQQKPLASHILKGDREYLTLPLQREILLSPPRSFFGSDESPPHSSHKPNNSTTFHARPMSPPNRSLLANLSKYLPNDSSKPTPVHAWNPAAASPAASPNRSSVNAPAASPSASHLQVRTTEPATSPKRTVGSPTRRSQEYLTARAEFHARSFPNSPVNASSGQQQQQQHLRASPSVTGSPISPRTNHALREAHAALERERERARAAHSHSHHANDEHKDSGASSSSSSAAFAHRTSGQQQQPPAHHRALFAEESHSQLGIISPTSSPSQKHSRGELPNSSPTRAVAGARSLHPLEPADFLSDSAQLDELLEVDADDVEEEGTEEVTLEEESFNEAALHAQAQQNQQQPYHHLQVNNSVVSAAPLSSAKILVAVRKRPLNSKEKLKGENDIVSLQSHTSLTVHEEKVRVDLTKYSLAHTFHFDAAFGENQTNEQIYTSICRPLVEFVMYGKGGRASCFAYGQTGAGKTHTLMGPAGGKTEQSGLYVLAANDLFRILKQRQQEELDRGEKDEPPTGQRTKFLHCSFFASFYEVYSGKLFDLLHSRRKLVCRADAAGVVHVVGLKERKCRDVSQLMAMIAEGNKIRSTGQTGANLDSSRSHAILTIALRQIVPLPGGKSSNVVVGTPAQFRLKTQGKFSFIDLAGSERASDSSDCDRQTRLESAEINKSLLALKECIRALDQGHLHTPFRGAILTQCLKDSFVGNSRTCMIANIGPNEASCEHTLNSLRYADRVKQLKKGAASGSVATNPPGTGGNVAAQSVPSGSKSARGSATAGNEAYMPHQHQLARPSGKPLFQARLSSVDRSAAVDAPASVSASPIRPASARPGMHGSQSMQQLSSASPARASQNGPAATDALTRHNELCARILAEEDALVAAHRSSIDQRMGAIKAEMEILRQFDSLGCTVDQYVKQLDGLLHSGGHDVGQLRGRIRTFESHLKEEEQLSQALRRS